MGQKLVLFEFQGCTLELLMVLGTHGPALLFKLGDEFVLFIKNILVSTLFHDLVFEQPEHSLEMHDLLPALLDLREMLHNIHLQPLYFPLQPFVHFPQVLVSHTEIPHILNVFVSFRESDCSLGESE